MYKTYAHACVCSCMLMCVHLREFHLNCRLGATCRAVSLQDEARERARKAKVLVQGQGLGPDTPDVLGSVWAGQTGCFLALIAPAQVGAGARKGELWLGLVVRECGRVGVSECLGVPLRVLYPNLTHLAKIAGQGH